MAADRLPEDGELRLGSVMLPAGQHRALRIPARWDGRLSLDPAEYEDSETMQWVTAQIAPFGWEFPGLAPGCNEPLDPARRHPRAPYPLQRPTSDTAGVALGGSIRKAPAATLLVGMRASPAGVGFRAAATRVVPHKSSDGH